MKQLAAAALLIAVVTASPPAAAPEPEPYGTNDAGGVRNILPPGSRGLSNAVELGAVPGHRRAARAQRATSCRSTAT